MHKYVNISYTLSKYILQLTKPDWNNKSLQTSKNGTSFLLLLMSSLQQNWKSGGWSGEGWGGGGERRQQGEMAQTIYAHMNKWIKQVPLKKTREQYKKKK
jgi:hypothetical protein